MTADAFLALLGLGGIVVALAVLYLRGSED